jgi:hypothetical protein
VNRSESERKVIKMATKREKREERKREKSALRKKKWLMRSLKKRGWMKIT